MLGRDVSNPVSITTNDFEGASSADAGAINPRVTSADSKTA
jgi:hypothetical protein